MAIHTQPGWIQDLALLVSIAINALCSNLLIYEISYDKKFITSWSLSLSKGIREPLIFFLPFDKLRDHRHYRSELRQYSKNDFDLREGSLDELMQKTER